jgi:hypothetical protein
MHERALALVRDHLDEAAIVEARRQGATLTYNAAVELALDELDAHD